MVQFGSEPLYDWAIYAADLANEVRAAKAALSGVGIPITVSEMAYGYQVVSKDRKITNGNLLTVATAQRRWFHGRSQGCGFRRCTHAAILFTTSVHR